jgi:N-acetylglutamate synthase-like GNAT family acetyltransferase
LDSSDVVIEPATREDWPGIRALVIAAQLPVAGLEDQFPGAFTVARYGQEVVGVAGLQRYGRFGLLRSVTVARTWRRVGIARALIAARFAAVRVAGVEGVYLLTTNATVWFLKLGFEQVARDTAPSELLASPEFVDACPASAACLRASSNAQLRLSCS